MAQELRDKTSSTNQAHPSFSKQCTTRYYYKSNKRILVYTITFLVNDVETPVQVSDDEYRDLQDLAAYQGLASPKDYLLWVLDTAMKEAKVNSPLDSPIHKVSLKTLSGIKRVAKTHSSRPEVKTDVLDRLTPIIMHTFFPKLH